jgi:hypothetical protein
MVDKIIDNGSAGSKLLKYDYPKLEVIGVNVASTIEDWFENLDPDNGKIYLPLNADELRADHEKLRQVIQGLETKGFRNKIVLPYEGMDSDSMNKQAKMWRPEWSKPKLPTAKGIDIGEKTKIESIALDVEVKTRGGIDPDDEMKAIVDDPPYYRSYDEKKDDKPKQKRGYKRPL